MEIYFKAYLTTHLQYGCNIQKNLKDKYKGRHLKRVWFLNRGVLFAS